MNTGQGGKGTPHGANSKPKWCNVVAREGDTFEVLMGCLPSKGPTVRLSLDLKLTSSLEGGKGGGGGVLQPPLLALLTDEAAVRHLLARRAAAAAYFVQL